jgi:CHAT domain-containing protein
MDMATARSQAALFVFGTCLAGIGEATVGNDETGFLHVVLASGARAFIEALWRVDNVSAMLLMREFYGPPSCRGGPSASCTT